MSEPKTKDIDIDVDALHRKYQEERSKRLRTDAVNQYQGMTGKFSLFDHDPYADPDFRRDPIVEDVDVVIIGAGFAGLLAGGRMRERGVKSIRIMEKGGDVGGTWYWNRYPGAACDVESYIYLPLLEETGYVPKERYSKASEILAYCKTLAERYDLYSGAMFHTEVHEVNWDEKRKRWLIKTNRNDAVSARFVISCTGLLTKPKLPGIPGIDKFQGHTFHTSRWDYRYTGGQDDGKLTGLSDKRVGIIGTGSTGIQAIPQLGEWAKQLYVFQRTPSSIDPRLNKETDPEWFKSLKPGWQKERMENFTLITAGVQLPVDMVNDSWTAIVRSTILLAGDTDTAADPKELDRNQLKRMEATRQRIAQIVEDPATAEALKPYYHYFCKRPCFHDEYLPTFNRPNVSLIDTKGRGVERITPSGVVVDGKEYKVDCLVFATGFEWLAEYAKEFGIEVTGPGGAKLSEYWGEGARTLWGIQTHGFPNFLMMSLIQAGAAVNYLSIADEQCKHIAYVVSECLERGIETIQPTLEAENNWIAEVVEAAKSRRAFWEACTPGYYNFEGKRGRAVELNDLFFGAPMSYINLLKEFREKGDFPLMHIKGAIVSRSGP